jgi:WD40 repeat protein
MHKLRALGAVARDAGSLTTLVADATDAASWKGADGDDYESACALLDAGVLGAPISWTSGSGGKGIFTDLGGAASAEVFRVEDDDLLVAALFAASDWSKATENQFREDVGALPAKASTMLGRISISSGVLALVWAVEPATRVTEQLLSTARSKRAVKRPWGILAALPNGEYEVVYERMDVSAPWGMMECRLRIGPAGRAPTVIARRPKRSPVMAKGRTALPPRHVLELAPGANRVASIAFSPDGQTLALGGSGVCTAVLFQVPELSVLATFAAISPGPQTFEDSRFFLSVLVAFDPASKSVALSLRERVEIRRFDGTITHRGVHVAVPGGERTTPRGNILPAIPLAERLRRINSLAFDRAHPFLFVDGARYPLEALRTDVHDLDDRELVFSQAACIIRDHRAYAWSPSGSRLLVSYPPRIVDRAYAFEEAPEGMRLPKILAGTLAWSPDEKWVALIEDGRSKIHLCDAATGETVRVLETASSRITPDSLAFHPDGSLLAVGQSDGGVRLFDTASWSVERELPNHDTRTLDSDARSIGAIAWSPDGRWLVVGNGLRGAPGAAAVYAAEDLRR